MNQGRKELIDEANKFFEVFGHSLSADEMSNLLFKQGFGDMYVPVINSNEQWKMIEQYKWLFKSLPFVEGIAVCNAVAMNTADSNSDIDLFMIVKKGRIFMARTLMTVIFHVLGIRRHGKKIRNRFCLTFFVVDSDMSLKRIAIDRDVYLKYWVLTLQVVSGGKVFEKFFKENGVRTLEERESRPGVIKKVVEWMFGGKIGALIEKTLKNIHLKRWQKLEKEIGDQHGIIVSETILKFHNIDMRKHYRDEFEKNGGKFVGTIFSSS